MKDLSSQKNIEESLLLAYVRRTVCETDRKIVEWWLKESPENEKKALQIALLYHAQRTKERIEKRNPEIAFEKLQRKQRQQKRRVYLYKITAVAAIAALLISLGLNTFLYNKHPLLDTQYITVQTNAGMRTNLNLPDGTSVHLNSGSKLTYPLPYDLKERKVSLEGEGYFDVAANPGHPFVVSVADDRMRIKVLGTRFNVNAYPDEDEVYATLVEGSVLLQFTDSERIPAEKRMETLGEMIYNLSSKHLVIGQRKLVPDEKATHNFIAGKTTIRKVNTINEYAWKDGKLIFKDTPMPEVLSKLSTYYNVKFVVRDLVINSYPFTGTFDNKQLFQVLDYFKHTSKITYMLQQVTEDDSGGTKHTTVILDR